MTTASEPEQTVDQHTVLQADWLVTFGPAVDHSAARDAVRRWRTNDTAFAVTHVAGSDVRLVEDPGYVVIFSGVLTNAQELQPGSTQGDAARIVLSLVKSRGVDAFNALRGPFAVIVWDRATGTLMAARDQIGMEPLFYARSGSAGWLLSPSPDVLTSQPGVSRAFDAVALSEWICSWFPAIEDTTYQDVKRVPPATVIRFRGGDSNLHRYWNPYAEPDVQWLGEKDLDAFEPLLARAVSRTTQGLSPAIFLSGGIDSISVAVAATDVARRDGTAAPLALSLAFPNKASNEEVIQKGVAGQLGLDQVILPFAEAIGPRGLLSEALSSGAHWPQPMRNIWAPGYMTLARHAAARGRRVILTGRGGDEWLTISPYLLADQLRRGDFLGALRLLRMHQKSNNVGFRYSAHLVWLAGCRPLASAAFDAIAPSVWHRRRRRRLLTELPDWVAPDPAIRRAIVERIDRWIEPARPAGGFYDRAGRTAVEHPAVAQDMEETQEFGRRHGLRQLHPYWDVDLLEMLRRVPPALLMADGRSKSVVRPALARRLPGLGLDRRAKVSALSVFSGMMDREAPRAWERLGGLRTLARIGVVSSKELQSGRWEPDLMRRVGGGGRLWMLLAYENWLQQRA